MIKPKKESNYSKAMIYLIKNEVNDKVYVGSTIQKPWKRWQQHLRDMKDPERQNNKLYTAMREFGVDNFYIEVHERCPCETKEQLEEIETRVILEFNTIENGYNYRRPQGRASDILRAQRKIDLGTVKETLVSVNVLVKPTQQFTVTF